MINAIGIQHLCLSLDFSVFESLIKTFIHLQRGSYNAHRCTQRHADDLDYNQECRKKATGSKYKYNKRNPKSSRSSYHRSLNILNHTLKSHQDHFNNNINLRDGFRSKDLKQNKSDVLRNRHLAREWKILQYSRDRKILTKLKKNDDRITNMTFNAHIHLLSIRVLEGVRHSVC